MRQHCDPFSAYSVVRIVSVVLIMQHAKYTISQSTCQEDWNTFFAVPAILGNMTKNQQADCIQRRQKDFARCFLLENYSSTAQNLSNTAQHRCIGYINCYRVKQTEIPQIFCYTVRDFGRCSRRSCIWCTGRSDGLCTMLRFIHHIHTTAMKLSKSAPIIFQLQETICKSRYAII